MNLVRRMIPVLLVLGMITLAEVAMRWHLSRHSEAAYPELAATFDQLPMEIRSPSDSADPSKGWTGMNHPHLEAIKAHLPYTADDILFRVYQRPGMTPVQLYMVFSRIGEDRKHHPEICIRDVSGAAEDLSARKTIALDSTKTRFAQRFRFSTGSRPTTVYYWHYAFPPLPRPERDWLQSLHLQLRHPSPSMTVQVSTTASPAELEVIEQSFVTQIDAALQSRQLPPSAVAGCNRLPIGLVRE